MQKRILLILFILVLNSQLLSKEKDDFNLVTPGSLIKILDSKDLSIKRKKAAISIFKKEKLKLDPETTKLLLKYIENCPDEEVNKVAKDILSLIPLNFPSEKIYIAFDKSAVKREKANPEGAGLLFSLAWEVAKGRVYGYEWKNHKENLGESNKKLMFLSINRVSELIEKETPVIAYVDSGLIGYAFEKLVNQSTGFKEIEERVISLYKLIDNCKSLKYTEEFYKKLASSPGTFAAFTELNSTRVVKKLITQALSNKNKVISDCIKSHLKNVCIPINNQSLITWWKTNQKDFLASEYYINIALSNKGPDNDLAIMSSEVFTTLVKYGDPEFISCLNKMKPNLKKLIFDEAKSPGARTRALDLYFLSMSKESKECHQFISKILLNKNKFQKDMRYELILTLNDFCDEKEVFDFLLNQLKDKNNLVQVRFRAAMGLCSSKKHFLDKKSLALAVYNVVEEIAKEKKSEYSVRVFLKALRKLTGFKKGSDLKAWKEAIDMMPTSKDQKN